MDANPHLRLRINVYSLLIYYDTGFYVSQFYRDKPLVPCGKTYENFRMCLTAVAVASEAGKKEISAPARLS